MYLNLGRRNYLVSFHEHATFVTYVIFNVMVNRNHSDLCVARKLALFRLEGTNLLLYLFIALGLCSLVIVLP